jgi:hypothetical protein
VLVGCSMVKQHWLSFALEVLEGIREHLFSCLGSWKEYCDSFFLRLMELLVYLGMMGGVREVKKKTWQQYSSSDRNHVIILAIHTYVQNDGAVVDALQCSLVCAVLLDSTRTNRWVSFPRWLPCSTMQRNLIY